MSALGIGLASEKKSLEESVDKIFVKNELDEFD